jgi:hypothetical protein
LTASTFSQAWFYNITYNNVAGVTGPKVNLNQFTSVMTNDGTLASIPGSTLSSIDNTSWLTAYGPPLSTVKGGGYLLEQFAGIPTVSQVPDGTLKWTKDTTGGGLYIVANDGGTIKTIGINNQTGLPADPVNSLHAGDVASLALNIGDGCYLNFSSGNANGFSKFEIDGTPTPGTNFPGE